MRNLKTNNSRTLLGLFLLLMLGIAQPAIAQRDSIRNRNGMNNISDTVVANYLPIVQDGAKLTYPPQQPVIKAAKNPMKYEVPVTLAPISYPPVSIKPLAINKEKPLEYQGSYLKLGFGSQFSPLAELMYSGHKLNGEVEKLNYGIYAYHLSAYGQKIKNQSFMDNKAAVFANFYPSQQFKIGARLDFENNWVYYYGYNHTDTSFSKSDIRQSYNGLNLDLNLAGAKAGKLGVQHESHVMLYGFFDKFKQQDIGVDVYTDLSKTIKKQHRVYLHMEDFFSTFKSPKITAPDTIRPQLYTDHSSNNNLLNIKPGYEYTHARFKIHGAFGICMDNSTFYPLPDLGAEFIIVPDYLIVYGGWNLENRKLTYQTLAQRNPWLENGTFGLKNTRFEDRFVGIKGTARNFTYDVGFAQKVMRNMPLFIYDTLDVKYRSLLVYDNVKIYDIHLGMEYRVNSDLDFAFHGNVNFYDPTNEQKAWGLPMIDAVFTARYKIAEKIFLKAEVFGLGRSQAKLAGGKTLELNGTTDVNVGATYKFSKYFSFFAELNNLANIKYQQYYKYPTYGFNGKLGVIFTY